MSRIAVRQSNGDDIEKIAFLAPLASALTSGAGMAARGIASLAGKTSIGRGIKAATGADGGIGSKLMAGAKAAGQQHMTNKVGAKATGGEGGEGGEDGGQENLAGKFVAQQMQQQADKRQQANQQSMQNNQAMAEKAKANSEIKTGEPMDMSWRLLKDWNWHHSLRQNDIDAIIERVMKNRKKTHTHERISTNPTKHHNDNFNERFHPHQKMPNGLDKYGISPQDVAHTMADMYLENHPELQTEMGREIETPNNQGTNTPGMSFSALTTDNPIVDKKSKHVWADYNPLFVEHNPLSGPQLHSQVSDFFGERAKAQNRHNIILTRNGSYPHTWSEHVKNFTSNFNLINPLSDITEEVKPKRKSSYVPAGFGEAREWTAEEQKEIDARRARLDAEKEAKQTAIQAEKEQELDAREQGEMSVTQNQFMPGFYDVTDPAYPIQGTMLVGPFDNDKGQGYDYYHNHYQNQQNVQTGEPMDLAWRMLKQMSDNDMQEWAYENLRNQGITIPDEREEEVIPKPEMPTLYY